MVKVPWSEERAALRHHRFEVIQDSDRAAM